MTVRCERDCFSEATGRSLSRGRFSKGAVWRGSGLQIHLQVSRLFESGRSLTLLPGAAKMALQSAGAISDTPGSPTPAGGALLSTT